MNSNADMTGAACREVAHGSHEYSATVEMRNELLRKPLGLALDPAQLATESDSYHITCYLNEELAGCLVLVPQSEQQVKMRQFVVAEQFRGKGVGRRLVTWAEKFCRGRGFTELVMHAREAAREFYEKLGYEIDGERFIEVTIPHYSMHKTLTLS